MDGLPTITFDPTCDGDTLAWVLESLGKAKISIQLNELPCVVANVGDDGLRLWVYPLFGGGPLKQLVGVEIKDIFKVEIL